MVIELLLPDRTPGLPSYQGFDASDHHPYCRARCPHRAYIFGTLLLCNFNDHMHMIGHNNIINVDVWISGSRTSDCLSCPHSKRCQSRVRPDGGIGPYICYSCIHPQKHFPVFRTEGHKISAWLAIIIFLQPWVFSFSFWHLVSSIPFGPMRASGPTFADHRHVLARWGYRTFITAPTSQ